MSNALKTVKLSRCRCGGHPVMNERISYSGNLEYSVYCNRCGRKTDEYYWQKYAAENWERMNATAFHGKPRDASGCHT